jgi:hypothetical protein
VRANYGPEIKSKENPLLSGTTHRINANLTFAVSPPVTVINRREHKEHRDGRNIQNG